MTSPQYTTLPRSFYEPSADVVAPLLLGHWMLRRTPQGLCGGIIVETEAYITGDPACHGYVRQTPRNKAMWGEPGTAYIYLIYGCHYCFNAVCRPPGTAEAVLVRAVEPIVGLELMRESRPVIKERDLTNGPGKLCAAMAIERALDEVDLCDTNSPLFIAQNPERESHLETMGPLVTTTRIGLTKAADWPLRFYLGRSKFVSRK